MNQVQTVIATVNGRNTSRGQVWDVVDQQGVTYTAWEPAQAQKADAMKGQPVLLSYTESQKGQYVNRSFKDAVPAAGAPPLLPQAAPAAQFPPQCVQHAPLPAAAALPVVPSAKGAEPSARDEQIIRQSAYKAAVDLISSSFAAGGYDGGDITNAMTDVKRVTDELVAYGLTGSWGGAAKQQPSEQEQQPTAPAAPWE